MDKLSLPGHFEPLGAHLRDGGVNFALYSLVAKSVFLILYEKDKPPISIPLHQTGAIWHIFILNLQFPINYAYTVDGEGPLCDPYALAMNTSQTWKANDRYEALGTIEKENPFDWEGVEPPNIPLSKLIIYEMHVRGFTKDISSGINNPGTFAGIIEKIPYLKTLGINAIELMPIFEFNEQEYSKIGPISKKPLCNYWGYSSVSFFSIMRRFASGDDPLFEFKTLVRELHRNGIEVILDVVYNHTAEGGKKGPIYSFKGIDTNSYYYHDKKGSFIDFTGCGNTLKCNYTPVTDMILNSLRYFAAVCQVDGFRFDLASVLTRGEQGEILEESPLIKRIVEDPILSNKKMIAEPWDAAGAYQVGSFPYFSEWNGFYRDAVRRFLKGSDGVVEAFTQAICGSEQLYKNKTPCHSINFITAHDGFTLNDLVSYQDKYNLDNGEENRDGANSNDNWNCGHEGLSQSKTILFLRDRQMKNFLVALFLSKGTPMLLMGDEYQHTRYGNNNAWCQDNELNWFLWDKNPDFTKFVQELITLRKNIKELNNETFFTSDDVQWHGLHPNKPDFGSHSRFIAYTMGDYYIAFNACFRPLGITLPGPTKWNLILDTYQTHKDDLLYNHFTLHEYSAAIFKANFS